MGKQIKENEIDFNNPDSFKKIVKEISKEKGIKGKYNVGDVPKNVIAFLTGNVKSVVFIAVWFLGSGLYINIKWIYNLFAYHLIEALTAMVILVLFMLLKKKIVKLYYSLQLKYITRWGKLKK